MKISKARIAVGALAALTAGSFALPAHAAWEPTRPVEFIIPAGTGGTMTQIRRIATARDEMILEERRKGTGAEAATPMLA